jgi:NAD+ kinase
MARRFFSPGCYNPRSMEDRTQPPVRRIGLVVKPGEPRARAVVAQLLEWAAARDLEVIGNADQPGDDLPVVAVPASQFGSRSDIIVALGGDGTMLGVARLVGDRGTPVLGVKFGTLGFLTEYTDADLFPSLEEVVTGSFSVDPRVTVGFLVERDGEIIANAVALNDVVVNKSALARMIEIDCWIDGLYVTNYRADGLIVSTPTGSTAYNLAAGGPILVPSMGAFVLNPICPHTLSNRPLVVPDTVNIDLSLRTRGESVMATIDGQLGFDIQSGDRILLRKSSTTFNVITPRNRNYFQVLRDKLRWGGQIAPPDR